MMLAAGVAGTNGVAFRQNAASTGASTAGERRVAWDAHQRLAASSPFASLPWRALGPTQ